MPERVYIYVTAHRVPDVILYYRLTVVGTLYTYKTCTYTAMINNSNNNNLTVKFIFQLLPTHCCCRCDNNMRRWAV